MSQEAVAAVEELAPQHRPECPQAGSRAPSCDCPQVMFQASPADIVVYGGQAGGGKTWSLLAEPLRYIAFHPVTGFYAVIFRRTNPEIVAAGGLWDESHDVYGHTNGTPVEGKTTWRWPGGQRVEMHHLQHEKDARSWKGAQVPLILFDQLEEFTESQFWYLISRNRSTCGVRPYLRATANPVSVDDAVGGWLAKLIQWWWDPETGYAIPERSGVVRWFLRDMNSGELQWADDPEEFGEEASEAMSLTFIAATLDDNPKLLERDPSYRAKLRAQNKVDHERLAKGNWKIRPEAGNILNRGWFKTIPTLPPLVRVVRYWDKAATEGGGAASAGVAIGVDREGRYIVADVRAGHWGIAQREPIIRQTAVADSKRQEFRQVTTWVEQEPGSGGKESAINTITKTLAGFTAYADRATGDKIERMGPFAAQARVGNVYVLEAEWTEDYLAHLHQVQPKGVLLDQADASAGAFNKLTQGRKANRRKARSVSARGAAVGHERPTGGRMPKAPPQLTAREAKALVQGMVAKPYKVNQKFYDGDHWQDGDGWIGPRLQQDAKGAQTVETEISKLFTSRNAIREVVNRHRDAAGGKEGRWFLTPVEEREDLAQLGQDRQEERAQLEERYQQQDEAIGQLEALLTEWWDERRAPQVLGKALVHLLTGERAPLRLYVPEGKLERVEVREDGATRVTYQVPPGTFREQLDRIYLDAPSPTDAGVYEDPDTKAQAAIFLEVEEEGGESQARVHVSFLDEADLTVFRVMEPGDDPTSSTGVLDQVTLDLGGLLPIHDMKREPFITEQVRQQQKACNLAYTMIPRNVIGSGFLERLLFNVELPGTWVEDENAPGGERFVQDPFYTGAGTTNVLVGVETEDADGTVRRATPSAQYREPTSPEPSEQAGRAHYQAILEETDQAHVLIAGDATASGVSREQARATFEGSLRPTTKELEAAVRWLLSCTMAMARAFATSMDEGLPELDQLRPVASPVVDLGPVDPETRRAVMEEEEKGLRSREGAMEQLDIEDVDAEVARIERQPAHVVKLHRQVQEVVLEYVREGTTYLQAAKLAGVTDQDLLNLYAEVDSARETPSREEAAQDDEVAAVLQGTAAEGGATEEEVQAEEAAAVAAGA